MYRKRRWREANSMCRLVCRGRGGEFVLVSPGCSSPSQYIGNGAKPHLVKNGKNTIMGFRNLLGHTSARWSSQA